MLQPEKDRSDSHNSSLREVPCTHGAFHEGIPSYEVNYEINEKQRKPIKKCKNAWIYKHPHTNKSHQEELNYWIVFGPSLAQARCAKVYELKIKKIFRRVTFNISLFVARSNEVWTFYLVFCHIVG